MDCTDALAALYHKLVSDFDELGSLHAVIDSKPGIFELRERAEGWGRWTGEVIVWTPGDYEERKAWGIIDHL